MRLAVFALAACWALPAWAEDLPQFPKMGPPGSLPDTVCDASKPSDGAWLIGRWVSPQSRWEFHRQGETVHWVLDRKGTVEDGMGWAAGARIDGTVAKLSPCSLTLSAGGDQFVMDGVLTEDGKLYGVAANAKGKTARFVLRRER